MSNLITSTMLKEYIRLIIHKRTISEVGIGDVGFGAAAKDLEATVKKSAKDVSKKSWDVVRNFINIQKHSLMISMFPWLPERYDYISKSGRWTKEEWERVGSEFLAPLGAKNVAVVSTDVRWGNIASNWAWGLAPVTFLIANASYGDRITVDKAAKILEPYASKNMLDDLRAFHEVNESLERHFRYNLILEASQKDEFKDFLIDNEKVIFNNMSSERDKAEKSIKLFFDKISKSVDDIIKEIDSPSDIKSAIDNNATLRQAFKAQDGVTADDLMSDAALHTYKNDILKFLLATVNKIQQEIYRDTGIDPGRTYARDKENFVSTVSDATDSVRQKISSVL